MQGWAFGKTCNSFFSSSTTNVNSQADLKQMCNISDKTTYVFTSATYIWDSFDFILIHAVTVFFIGLVRKKSFTVHSCLILLGVGEYVLTI